jgi:hypothetical protein
MHRLFVIVEVDLVVQAGIDLVDGIAQGGLAGNGSIGVVAREVHRNYIR